MIYCGRTSIYNIYKYLLSKSINKAFYDCVVNAYKEHEAITEKYLSHFSDMISSISECKEDILFLNSTDVISQIIICCLLNSDGSINNVDTFMSRAKPFAEDFKKRAYNEIILKEVIYD